jgi:hypothetical protein
LVLAKGQPTVFHAIDAVPPVVHRALPNISADELLGGCGNHRYRDDVLDHCRAWPGLEVNLRPGIDFGFASQFADHKTGESG